jgi:hypothetical protein
LRLARRGDRRGSPGRQLENAGRGTCRCVGAWFAGALALGRPGPIEILDRSRGEGFVGFTVHPILTRPCVTPDHFNLSVGPCMMLQVCRATRQQAHICHSSHNPRRGRCIGRA